MLASNMKGWNVGNGVLQAVHANNFIVFEGLWTHIKIVCYIKENLCLYCIKIK
jgi:hypothetical protein